MKNNPILLIFLTLWSAGIGASGFTIYPNRVELSADNYRQTFKLMSPDEGTKVIQVRLYRWTQKEGVDIRQPSNDLIVMPPVVKLTQGVEKTVRVGFRKPMVTDHETTYRIEFKEIPKKFKVSGVNLAFTQSVPIYYKNDEKWKSELTVESKINASDSAELLLSNTGRRHSIVKQLKLTDLEIQEIVWQSDKAFAILSNSFRKFVIPNSKFNKEYKLEIETKDDGVHQHKLSFQK